MKRTGKTVATKRRRAVAHGPPEVDPHDGDHGVTMRRTRARASPTVTSGDEAQDEERADDARARIAEQGQPAEADERPAVGRAPG